MKRTSHAVTAPVTIIDVAQAAGVSYATVSRVINNETYVKQETRQRVTEALNRLGYVVNRQARSLRGGRSHTIGLLVRELGTSYVGEIVRGIDQELAGRHYDLMLYTSHLAGRNEATYVETLTRSMVDGLLLILPRTPESYLERLRLRGVPHVLIDHDGIDDDGPVVAATNVQGGQAGTQHLLSLGHRRIGFITGDLKLRCSLDRLQGYRAAMCAAGVGVDEQWIVEGDFSQPSGYQGATKLLNLDPSPTAIFAANDVMAFGVMEAVRERGWRIAEDVSIVGFDDIPQAAHVHPPLTTVRQPLEEMGRVAAQLLLDYIENGDFVGKQISLPTQLVIRHSCQSVNAVA